MSSDDEDEDPDQDQDHEETEDALLLLGAGQYPHIQQILEEEQYLEEDEVACPVPCLAATEEKETNTECCVVCPDGGRRLLSADDRLAIKRSQTFSPTPQLAKNHYICRYLWFLDKIEGFCLIQLACSSNTSPSPPQSLTFSLECQVPLSIQHNCFQQSSCWDYCARDWGMLCG